MAIGDRFWDYCLANEKAQADIESLKKKVQKRERTIGNQAFEVSIVDSKLVEAEKNYATLTEEVDKMTEFLANSRNKESEIHWEDVALHAARVSLELELFLKHAFMSTPLFDDEESKIEGDDNFAREEPLLASHNVAFVVSGALNFEANMAIGDRFWDYCLANEKAQADIESLKKKVQKRERTIGNQAFEVSNVLK
ncbi:unnamed protein product [Ilex paraguariensis]|uniref:Uncharacterized protein n=1 Tax=Ilex paraguariensis TaxID=185542 RepID=A0ABC8RWR3_9AQUA